MTHLSLTFLGAFQAALDGRSITTFESDKVRALLIYLAVEEARPHRRDTLAGLLWPDWSDRAARTNLRNALANLRGAIGDRNTVPPFLHITRDTIQFNSESNYWLDTKAFAQLAASNEPQTLEAAVTLYHGDFLAGFQLKDSAAFENWYLLMRERLQRQALTILRRLADCYQQQNEYEQAAIYAWRQVELEPWQEKGHQQLMRLLTLSGQRSAALAQYETCRRQLIQELGVAPAAETTQLYEQIRDGELTALEPAQFLDMPPAPGTPPYKGLQFFDEADADWFFGREALIKKLAMQVDPVHHRSFLAIVGASGSGKSSIVRAGLIPTLRQGEIVAGSAVWPVHILTPSSSPLQTLAVSLTGNDVSLTAVTTLIDNMASDPRFLSLHINQLLPPDAAHLLLIVDQFEELFTQCQNKKERQAFVDNLMTAVAVSGPAMIIITLRADFYAHCGMYTALREALETNQVYIGPMTMDELRRAVTKPAQLGNWSFEPGLVDFMLQEVADEPGALPLLSHALLETWQRRRGRMLTLAGYNESGGVRGAIACTAERVMQQLTPQQRHIARSIFLRLTELGDATQETRRRAKLSELSQGPEEDADVAQVLQTLVDARLVIADKESAVVAHEALIREWPMLHGWLEADREGLRTHRHLTDAAQEWERLGHDAGELYRGARLAMCSEWAKDHVGVLNPLEREFLAASQTWAQRQVADREAQQQRELAAAHKVAKVERRRAEEHAQSARRLRSRALLLVVVSLLAVALAVIALMARASAQRETAVNRSLVLANLAVEADEVGEVDRALAFALAAVNMDDPPSDAISKLAAVANGMGTRAILSSHNGAVRAGDFGPDGNWAISGGCVHTGVDGICRSGELILWDLTKMTAAARWSGHDNWITALAWRPGSEEVLSGGEDGYLFLWDAPDQAQLAQWELGGGTLHAIAISSDGTTAAVASDNGVITVLDLTQRQIVHQLHGHSGTALAVAWSPDGQQLVSGATDTTMILWDKATGKKVQTFQGYDAEINGVAFLPDGNTILSSGGLTFRLWDAVTGTELQRRESGDLPDGLVFSPDGRTVLHYVSHIIYAWDAHQWVAPHRKLFGHEGDIHHLAISANGRFALSTSDDGTLRIWNLRGTDDLQVTDIGFSATGMAVAPDNQTLAIGGWQKGSRIWDLGRGEPTLQLTGGIGIVAPGAITFSPDGHWVAASSGEYDQGIEDSSLIVWEAITGDIQCDLQGHKRRVRTAAFAPDSRTLLSGSQGVDNAGDLILWSVANCGLVRRFETEQDTTGIDFSDNGRTAFTSSAFSENAALWDVETGQQIRIFSLPGEVLLDAAFGPEDETVLAGTIRGAIVQWDVATGAEINRFVGHDGGVWSITLSPDERKMVSSDDTGMIILWDMVTGKELRRHNAHNALSFQAAFSSDGQTVYSVSADGTLAAWRVGEPSLLALRAWIEDNRYVRPLSCVERAQYHITPLCD